ncbi:hypothetical protein [Caballeronia sp. DA-9]|uniref:hypothetical protein n=1 Tax=Caballeronia sp. DA-9 TaxID=3436237 RepID=UPI003F67D1D4
MNPKLAAAALIGALSLSGCYYVPYGYYPTAYPAYPGAPVVSTAQTQREIPVAPNGASDAASAQAYDNAQADTQANAQSSSGTYAVAAPPPVVYAPAYYPSYPVYAPYPAYYGYPYGYGYGGPSVSIGFGWWGGGGGHGHYHH